MDLQSSRKSFRLQVNCYFLFIGIATLVYGAFLARWSRTWIISDWLINYQAGFVRRGLPGELLFRLGHLIQVPPLWFVAPLTVLLYVFVLLAVRSLALASSGRLWILALLFSPATLSFPILDAEAGFRKEVIYLAALLGLVMLLRRGRLSPVAASAVIASSLAVAVFSHESLVCYAPYFFAALLVGGRTVGQAAAECAVPFALALGAAYLCSHHLGDLRTAAHICHSLGYPLIIREHGHQICDGGAIAYLGYSRAMARQEELAVVRDYHYLLIYPVLAALAVLPLVFGSLALARAELWEAVQPGLAVETNRKLRLLWGSAALSILGSLVLFLFAVDWGRWIYLHVFSIGILLMFLDGQRRERSDGVAEKGVGASPGRKLAAGLLLAVYATTWSLPHYAEETYRFGYLGLLRHVFFDPHSIQHGARP